MLLVTSLIAGLMLLAARSRRRTVVVLLIGCMGLVAVYPPPAQAQLCLPCVIQTVLTTINQTIGGWLNAVISVTSNIFNFYQLSVWRVSSINQIKGQIQSIIAQFRGVMQSIMAINPHTATLPNPMALENIIRNRVTSDDSSVPQMYVNTFRPVPPPGQMAPPDRNMTDMDDAFAQDNLMIIKAADQAQDLELQLADAIETMVGNGSINVSAPGTSSLITAAAAAGQIKSHAIMQKMLAAMLRQEAGRVAHDNALRKRNAALAGLLQTHVGGMLH